MEEVKIDISLSDIGEMTKHKFQSIVNEKVNCCACHYIILNNGILKSNSSIFSWSEGYITQYTL